MVVVVAVVMFTILSGSDNGSKRGCCHERNRHGDVLETPAIVLFCPNNKEDGKKDKNRGRKTAPWSPVVGMVGFCEKK